MSESDTVPVGAINTTLPVPTSVVKADYTLATIPQFIKDKVVKNNVLFVDVVNAGAKAGTGLEEDEATDLGLIKNHWTFRAHLDFGEDGQEVIGQVYFGMDITPHASIGSNEGQYARSSNRSDPDSGTDVSYSPVGSFSKPPAPGSDEGVPVTLLGPASGEGSHDTHDSQSIVFSDLESVGKPPDITSSGGYPFQQPAEGAPHPGVFNIKVRDRTGPSHSVVVVFQFDLAPSTTFGQLLQALIDRNMEPFFFRKIGVAYLGCRDFISQATAAWLHDGLLVSGQGKMVVGGPDIEDKSQVEGDIETKAKHIFSLLGWRYTNPLVPVNVSDVSDPGVETQRGAARNPNYIDRAVWPANFVHVEDEKLNYNQIIVNPTA